MGINMEIGLPYNIVLNGQSFIKKYLSRYNYIVNASSAVFVKDAIKNIDKSYKSYRGCGDWVFWIEIAKGGVAAYLNQPLNYFRQHGTNTTEKQTILGKGEIEVAAVTRFLKTNKYIGLFEIFRIKVILYSIKYGKLSSLYQRDTKELLLKGWDGGILEYTTIRILCLLKRIGIQLVKR
jgi:hypothetical protein